VNYIRIVKPDGHLWDIVPRHRLRAELLKAPAGITLEFFERSASGWKAARLGPLP
jgi:hypothetical protein